MQGQKWGEEGMGMAGGAAADGGRGQRRVASAGRASTCQHQRAGRGWSMAAEWEWGRSGDGGMGQREQGWLWGRGVTCLSYFGDDQQRPQPINKER